MSDAATDALVKVTTKLTASMARRLDRELADARAACPHQQISKSTLIRHALGQFLDGLDAERAGEPSSQTEKGRRA